MPATDLNGVDAGGEILSDFLRIYQKKPDFIFLLKETRRYAEEKSGKFLNKIERRQKGMKTVKLYLRRSIKVYAVVCLSVLTMAGLWLLIWFLSNEGSKALPSLFFSFALLVLTAWGLNLATRIPHTILYRDDHVCEFLASTRKTVVSPLDIISISPWGGGIGFFSVRHRKGTIIILNQFDGFHELINLIKTRNAHVEIRGC
jgi:hypothetical protein